MLTVDLIDYYRAIEATALEMLHAAQAKQWDELTRLEQCCEQLVAALEAQKDSGAPLSGELQKERFEILLRLVRIDADVRLALDPREHSLSRLLWPAAGSQRLH
jgi:flagellar protein FliT